MDPLSLAGKVALITGGGSGIGLASAKAFGQHNAKVGVLDLNMDRAEQACADLRADGIDCLALSADVSKSAQVQTAVEACANHFGQLDIVFANAGINGVWGMIEDISPEDFENVIAVNLNGTFYTIKYAVPFLKQNGGSIVITSSINGTRNFSNAGASPYSSSKAAQVALAKMMAVELGQFGVRVNAICPGYIPSNIHDGTIHRNQHKIRIQANYPGGTSLLKDHATAEQVGDLVLFLVSDMAKHITGEVVYIDRGTSLVIG
ncbi:SDR family NAD(P)-dependent oxidoreductase [soil metagenome]